MEIDDLVNQGKYEKALDRVIEVRKLSPNDYNLLIQEANLYFRLGDNNRYLENLIKALNLKPNDPILLFNIAVIKSQLGSTKEAIVYYEKAITIKPDYYDALLNLGILEQNVGNIKNAIIYYEKALALDSSNYQLNITLGDIYLNQANIKTREANENQDNPTKWKEIFLQRLGFFKKAMALYESALQIDGSDDGLKEQIPILQAKIKQANTIISTMK